MSRPLPVKGKFERGVGLVAIGLLIFAALTVGHWTINNQLPTLPTAATTREVTVSAYMWGFYPDVIKVNESESITLKITSLDVVHGIASDHEHWGIDALLEPEKTVTLEFEPEHPGEYTVRCTAYCGAQHSQMVATLLVTS